MLSFKGWEVLELSEIRYITYCIQLRINFNRCHNLPCEYEYLMIDFLNDFNTYGKYQIGAGSQLTVLKDWNGKNYFVPIEKDYKKYAN